MRDIGVHLYQKQRKAQKVRYKDMKATLRRNEEKHGIEITFNEFPSKETRTILKETGFRWHSKNKYWYAKETDARLKVATDICESEEFTTFTTKEEVKTNKFGVQVGDIFSSSWGYEQTNVDFYQVIELVGETSVRVREVIPPMIDEKPTCSMAADRTYKLTRELLPPTRSIFIKDQEKGDLKRLKSYDADGVSHPLFKVSSTHNAYYCEPGEVTEYESWYA